jgi:hypothetical protein
VSDHCGHCGKALRAAPLGGTYQCCPGGAYWSKRRPLPRDAWAVLVSAEYGVPLWKLYSSPNLPRGMRFIQPWIAEE